MIAGLLICVTNDEKRSQREKKTEPKKNEAESRRSREATHAEA